MSALANGGKGRATVTGRSRVFSLLNLLGLLCSAVAGVLLLYAIPLERTNYRLVETKTHEVSICFSEKKVVAGYGGPLVAGDEPCPSGIGPSVTPAIQYEHPSFVTWGLLALVIGFVLQVPAGICAIWRP
jgi:hypothetical protein